MKKRLCSCLLSLLCFTAPAFALDGAPSLDTGSIARFGFGNILMGAWTEQDGWVTARNLQGTEHFHFLRLWGGESCRIFGLNGLKGEGVMSALHHEHPGEFPGSMPNVPSFDTHTPEGVLKAPSGLLTILCPWEVQPRQPVALSLNSSTYQGIVKRFLADQGLNTEKPNLVQLFKIDLEGDGVDEVLICAQNIAGRGEASFEDDQPLVTGISLSGTAQPGAYSVLLLRKIVDGRVLELPLHVFVSPLSSSPADDGSIPPVIAKVFQFADLNGDGILEIIAGTACCEGWDYRVFKVKGGEVREVLTQGIGNEENA